MKTYRLISTLTVRSRGVCKRSHPDHSGGSQRQNEVREHGHGAKGDNQQPSMNTHVDAEVVDRAESPLSLRTMP